MWTVQQSKNVSWNIWMFWAFKSHIYDSFEYEQEHTKQMSLKPENNLNLSTITQKIIAEQNSLPNVFYLFTAVILRSNMIYNHVRYRNNLRSWRIWGGRSHSHLKPFCRFHSIFYSQFRDFKSTYLEFICGTS